MIMGYKSKKKQYDFLGLYPIFLFFGVLLIFISSGNILVANELQGKKINEYIFQQNSKLKSSILNPKKYSKLIDRYNSLLINKNNRDYLKVLDSLTSINSIFEQNQDKIYKLQESKFDWLNIGPKDIIKSSNKNAFGNGRINCLSFVNEGSLENMYAGTALGGLWYSNNEGKNWEEVEINNNYFLGISDIETNVQLKDENDNIVNYNILIATGDSQGAFFSYQSNGILASKDNGKTWKLIIYFDLDISEDNGKYNINKILFVNGKLYIATTIGLFLVEKLNFEWISLKPKEAINGTQNQNIRDIIINGDNLIYSTYPKLENENAKLYKYDLQNSKINQISLIDPKKPNSIDTNNIIRIAFSKNNQFNNDILMIGATKPEFNTAFVAKLNKSDFKVHTIPINEDPVFKQGYYNLCIERSPFDENIIYMGGVNLFKTNDNFTTLKSIGNNENDIHVDHHNLYFSQKYNRIYSVNDGGIYYQSPSEDKWVYSSEGISANQNYTVSVSDFLINEIWSCSQDNGISKTIRTELDVDSDFEGILTGDGIAVLNSQINPNLGFMMLQRGDLYYTNDKWKTINKANLNYENTNWITKIKPDENLFELVYKEKINGKLNKYNEKFYLGKTNLIEISFNENQTLKNEIFLSSFENIDKNPIDDFIVLNKLNKVKNEVQTFSLVAKNDKIYYFDNSSNIWKNLDLGFDFEYIQNIRILKPENINKNQDFKFRILINAVKDFKSELYILEFKTFDNQDFDYDEFNLDNINFNNLYLSSVNGDLPPIIVNDVLLNYKKEFDSLDVFSNVILATDLGVFSNVFELDSKVIWNNNNIGLSNSVYTSIKSDVLNNRLVLGSFGRGTYISENTFDTQMQEFIIDSSEINPIYICNENGYEINYKDLDTNSLYIWNDGYIGANRSLKEVGSYQLYKYNNQRIIAKSKTIEIKQKLEIRTNILVIGDLLCPKDSLIYNINIMDNYNNIIKDITKFQFIWYDDYIGHRRAITESGLYSLKVIDSLGCEKNINLGNINLSKTQKIEIIQNADSLTLETKKLTQNGKIEWYLNSIKIDSLDEKSSIKINSFGLYKAKLVYDGFCFDFSNELNILSNNDIKLKTYPNPFTETCEIEISNPKLVNIGYDIYDFNSKLVESKVLGNSISYKHSLNFSEKSIGNYYIRLFNADNNKIDYLESDETSSILVKMK